MARIKITVVASTLLFFLLLGSIIGLYWYWKKPQYSLFIPVIDQFQTTEKIIALTFDDGPSPVNTPPLLDLLKRHQVKASFFVIGQRLQNNVNIAKRIIDDGHQIANHSFTHPHLSFCSKDFIRNEIQKTDSLLRELQVDQLDYFRAPYGDQFINLPLVLKEYNKKLIAWNVESMRQYEEKMDSEATAMETLKQCKPGSIILLHDAYQDQVVDLLKTVEKIIIELKKRGYTFVTVDEGLKYVNLK